jgi:hypothetical protein
MLWIPRQTVCEFFPTKVPFSLKTVRGSGQVVVDPFGKCGVHRNETDPKVSNEWTKRTAKYFSLFLKIFG